MRLHPTKVVLPDSARQALSFNVLHVKIGCVPL